MHFFQLSLPVMRLCHAFTFRNPSKRFSTGTPSIASMRSFHGTNAKSANVILSPTNQSFPLRSPSSTPSTLRASYWYRSSADATFSGCRYVNHVAWPKYGAWPLTWNMRNWFRWFLRTTSLYVSFLSTSYCSIRYWTMAPDSHSTRPVFGSSMAGTRPLGLMSLKGFFLTSSNLMDLMV
jgi:hypothetical protein